MKNSCTIQYILHTTTPPPPPSPLLPSPLWWVLWPLWQSWASSSRYDPWRTRSIRRRRDEKPVWGGERASYTEKMAWFSFFLHLQLPCCNILSGWDGRSPISLLTKVICGPNNILGTSNSTGNFGRQIGSGIVYTSLQFAIDDNEDCHFKGFRIRMEREMQKVCEINQNEDTLSIQLSDSPNFQVQ